MKRTGAGWQLVSGLLFLAALAGCQPQQPQEQPDGTGFQPPVPPAVAEPGPKAPAASDLAADTLPPVVAEAEPAEPVWSVVNCPGSQRILQVHRYVGTVDGQPATAELQWYSPDSIVGYFYRHRAGPAYVLRDARQQPGPVVLTVDSDAAAAGRWHLRSRPGVAVLQAIWRDGQRQRTIAMRESYAGAVRYGVRTFLYASDSAGSILHNFLWLPFPALVHPRLRPLLNPGPQARLRQMDEARENQCYAYNRLSVQLNGFGLFSYRLQFESRQTDGQGGRKDEQAGFLFDLVSGQPLTVESQLRSDYEMPLRRLLAGQLPPDAKGNWCLDFVMSNDPTLADLPDMGLSLTATGLEATYTAAQVCGRQTLHLPYAKLRPLVRPGTPLARMLKARGMW